MGSLWVRIWGGRSGKEKRGKDLCPARAKLSGILSIKAEAAAAAATVVGNERTGPQPTVFPPRILEGQSEEKSELPHARGATGTHSAIADSLSSPQEFDRADSF